MRKIGELILQQISFSSNTIRYLTAQSDFDDKIKRR
jgi:hypothetical protein